MIAILIYAILLLLIFAVLFYAVDLLPADPQIKAFAKVLLALVLVLLLLGMIFGQVTFPALRALP